MALQYTAQVSHKILEDLVVPIEYNLIFQAAKDDKSMMDWGSATPNKACWICKMLKPRTSPKLPHVATV